MKEICLNPSYMNSNVISTYLHLFPLRVRVICPIDRPVGLPWHRCTYLSSSRGERKERINKKKENLLFHPLLFISPRSSTFFLHARSYGAVSRERVYEGWASPPVFSRPRRPGITFGFKEASRGVRAGMHEIRDGTTKESPFRIDVDAFHDKMLAPKRKKGKKKKRKMLRLTYIFVPFHPFLSRFLLLATNVPFTNHDKFVKSLFIHFRILKIWKLQVEWFNFKICLTWKSLKESFRMETREKRKDVRVVSTLDGELAMEERGTFSARLGDPWKYADKR